MNGETKVDRNKFIENLRTTLLWQNVCSHIESKNDANVLLQRSGLEDNITAESAFIQDSEDFYITAISENSSKSKTVSKREAPGSHFQLCPFKMFEDTLM